MTKNVYLVGTKDTGIFPWQKEEKIIAVREAGTEPFEISDFEREYFDKVTTCREEDI